MRGGTCSWLLAAVVVLGVAGALPAAAVTSTVPCSSSALQDAVSAAAETAEDDVLVLAGSCTYTVTTTLDVPPQSGVLTLRGSAGTVLDGDNETRILRVHDNASAVLRSLVLRGGRGVYEINQERGGAVRSTGTLRVEDSAFVDNAGGRVGGAIDTTIGTTTVVRSLFMGNSADSGGAIYAEGQLTVVSSTFAQNASAVGDAILSFAKGTISSSTFSRHDKIALYQAGGPLAVVNTVLAGNGRNCGVAEGGSLTDLGGNVEDQAGTCQWSAETSRQSTEPRLQPLADNGGPTRTFAPGPGSPLLDRGARCSEGGPAIFDQRRQRRPATGCDIGAVESAAESSLTGDGAFGEVTGAAARRTFTLRSTGADPLVVGEVSATGGAFRIATDSCSGRRLPKGTGCSVAVEAAPAGAGRSSGELVLVDSADAAPRRVALSAVRPAAAASRLPSPPPGASPAPSRSAAATAAPTATATPAAGPPPPLDLVEPPQRIDLGNGEALLRSTSRSAFPQALPLPTQVSLEVEDLVRSGSLAALLLLLLGLPIGLVNDTLSAHRDELAARWARARRGPLRIPEHWYADLPLRVAAPTAALVSALVYGFLDPSFGWNRPAFASVLGLLVTIVTTGLLARQTRLRYLRRRFGVGSSLRLLPGFVALAVLCTVLSRTSGLQPGLVLGSVLGIQFARGLRWHEEGRAIAVSSAALAAAGTLCWFLWVPVAQAAATPTPALVVLVLDVALAAAFVVAVEALAFGLVPLRFLDGAALWRWSKRAWLACAGIGMFGFVHVVLHPDDGAAAFLGRERYLLVLLSVYLVCGFAFWGFFRFRRQPVRTA